MSTLQRLEATLFTMLVGAAAVLALALCVGLGYVLLFVVPKVVLAFIAGYAAVSWLLAPRLDRWLE